MPKENIDDMVTDGFRAKVTWRAGETGYVQLATVSENSPFKWPPQEGCDDKGDFDGWHVTLDRAGINRLIRVLRRARDAAFGRDE